MIDLPFFWKKLKETEEIFEVKFLQPYAHSQFAAAVRLNFTHTFLIKLQTKRCYQPRYELCEVFS